jgi:transcriptional regulator GlxA family with amidase domain
VFSLADERHGYGLFDVSVVAATADPVRAKNGLRILPDQALAEASPPDVLILPGGDGSKEAMLDHAVIEWVRTAAAGAEITMTVCTGTRIAGAAGLLDGREYTTHHEAAPAIAELFRSASQRLDRRIVDTGPFVSTGGISAGIDGAFHVLGRLSGEDVVRETAGYMEYELRPG